MVDMMKKLRQIISLVLVLVMFFDYGAVSASYEPASYAVAAVAGLEELIQSTEPEEIQGEEAEAAEAPDLAELPEQPEDAQPGEAPEDAQQSEDPDALLQAERVSPLTGLLNQVSRLSAPYRDDGYIHIYNYDMLSLIGTGLPVEAEDVFHGYADNREADAPEAPDWGEEPEQPAQVEQPEQPAQVEQPEQPAEVEQPEQPAEAEEPEQPAETEQPAVVEQPAEPEQVTAPEASALPEASQQPGEALLTQVVGRALSRVLVRDTAAPQRAVTATLAAAVAEVTGEEAAPQELAEDAPAELQGEAQPETDPDPMTDPAQTAAEPALPVAAGESAPDDSDTLPTDAEPAPDAVPAQDSEEPEAPAATGTSPTESDADTDTYYNNDENNEEPAPAADPAEPEEIAEPEDGEAAPPAAQPELIDDPDVVDSPETGDLSQQPDEPVDEPTDAPDEGTALTESKYYYYPNGELVRYTSDANYFLECDIELPSENCWTLPEDFTGSFTGRGKAGDGERIYDSETDTIYIHNPLQLLEMTYESREEDPLMSGDIDVYTFGTGLLVFTDGSQGDASLSDDGDDNIVTYSAKRNYVLSAKSFTGNMKGAGGLRSAANPLDGRTYPGQVTITLNTPGLDGDGNPTITKVPYILIGDLQQLQAINSSDTIYVCGPTYRVHIKRSSILDDWEIDTDYPTELVYPGDADLVEGEDQNRRLYDQYNAFNSPWDRLTGGLGLYNRTIVCGIDETTGEPDISKTGTNENRTEAGLKYDRDANYIVFRDIDMRGTDWTPLTFTGTMYGITSTEAEQKVGDITPLLGTADGTGAEALAAERKPVISNMKIEPATTRNITGDLCVDLGKHSGVGFFGTITKYDNDLTSSDYTIVKNIKLAHGTVTNNAVYAYDSAGDSLVSILLDFLSGGLDVILNPILSALVTGGFDVTMIDLNTLLSTRSTSPDALATGAFAGIISGRAVVDYCEVECFDVNTVATLYETGTGAYQAVNSEKGGLIVGKGGFVGAVGSIATAKPDGERGTGNGNGIMYEGISQLLGGLKEVLTQVLNVGGLLSFVGLGDVITLLLENLLNVGVLIPAGYTAPTVKNCAADKIVLSTEDGKFGVGGFSGVLTGASLENCTLSNSDYLVVDADMFGGGFTGLERDAVIPMTLTGLGLGLDELIELLGAFYTNSELINCQIVNSDVTVQGGSKLGGFAGAQFNSYAFDCTADANSKLVIRSIREAFGEVGGANGSAQNYVGGFTGLSTMGTAVSADGRDHTKTNTDLLSTVTGLVTGLLTGGQDGSGALLSVSGVEPSAIMGCQLLGSVEVSTPGDYAGGLVGRGEATVITRSSPEIAKEELRKYRRTDTAPDVPLRCNAVMKLVRVHAGRNYAGGIAGQLVTGSGVGLLNNITGLADVIGFRLENTTVKGISLNEYRAYYSMTRQKTHCPDKNTDPDADWDHSDKFTPYLIESTHIVDPAHNYDGYMVDAGNLEAKTNGNYVGGGVGFAAGGDIIDVVLDEMAYVKGVNYVGGFAGAAGPGDIASAGSDGLSIGLFGVTLAKASDLLSLGDAVRTKCKRVTVNGMKDGLTVEAVGEKSNSADPDIVAGGFVGGASSIEVVDCHVTRLRAVIANMADGKAGGFVGKSSIGGLLGVASGNTSLLSNGLLNVSDLLHVGSYLVPKFDGCHVGYVNNGYVQAWCAGGFAGDFESGLVNTNMSAAGTAHIYETVSVCDCDASCVCLCCCDSKTRGVYTYGTPENPWSVENIGYVHGGKYAGGWGGWVHSGALADAGSGGVSLLGNVGVNLSGLLSLFSSYVPMIMYAGVRSSDDTHLPSDDADGLVNGFAVYAADDAAAPTAPATDGYAGGYIGYACGVQISYSDVNQLKTGTIHHPDYLEEIQGEEYMDPVNFHTTNGANPLAMEYAVAGAHYAGGYVGHLDVGSSAAVGNGLNALGNAIQLTNVLDALNVVVSTIEHSDVYGAPGGFNIIASPRINNPANTYGDSAGNGFAYAGGFAGRMSGGHTQDSNVDNFEYIVGEIAAGGYVGEMEPGSVANALGDDQSILGNILNVNSLVSVMQDFIPTIRNSQTTCVPCGGAVRAQCPSYKTDTNTVFSGMAGGYVGHMIGGQIWGFSDDKWRSQGDMDSYVEQEGATVGSGNNREDVLVYVFDGPEGKTVYRLVKNYNHSLLVDENNASLTSADLFYAEKNIDGTTKYVKYTGDGSDLTAHTRAAKDKRSALLLAREIQADVYLSSDGTTVYKYKEDNYRGGDFPLVSNNGAITANDYFTITTTNGVWNYTKYTLPADNPETQNVDESVPTFQNADPITLRVSDTQQLMVDAHDRNGNPVMREGNNYDDYGYRTIYLRGRETQEPQRQCAAIRIRSVYGYEHAGGYVGKMECGSTVDTGGLSLLGGLVDASNVLSALDVTYSTIRFGYVNGPMRGGDELYAWGVSYDDPWQIYTSFQPVFLRAQETISPKKFLTWYYHVGQYGGLNKFEMDALEARAGDPDEFKDLIASFVYCYNVRAGRGSNSVEYGDADTGGYEGGEFSLSGTAGGFIGSMWSGMICDSEGLDARNILSMRASGGFAGEMLAKGLANFGSVNLIGGAIPLNLGSLLSVADVLVPSIARSGITGYQSGLTVIANGDRSNRGAEETEGLGNAGGFVGASYGGQIGLVDEDSDPVYRELHPNYSQSPKDDSDNVLGSQDATIWVDKLLHVKGTVAAGGFVGKCSAASVLTADTTGASGGMIQSLLDSLISSPGGLVQALQATVATIKNTVVNALNAPKRLEEYAVLRQRYIDQRWASEGAQLLAAYKAEHPDEFQNSQPDNATIEARIKKQLGEDFDEKYFEEEYLNDEYGIVIDGYEGRLPKYAGGFAGTLEATVVGEHDHSFDKNVVNKLRGVYAREYAGGFFGLADVGSVAQVGSSGGTSILGLIGAGNVGVLDAFRTYIYYSEVNGVLDGIRVVASEAVLEGTSMSYYEITGAAGGFGGRMNNGTIEYSSVSNLNYVEAKNYAGGFVGYLGKNKLVDAQGVTIGENGQPVSPLTTLVQTLGLGTGLNLGALNVVGATVTACTVTGYGAGDTNIGFDVKATEAQTATQYTGDLQLPAACAAGFVGYADISQIDDSTVDRLKKVTSKQIAAGYVGRGTKASIADAEIDNDLVDFLLRIVGFLVFRVLNLDDLSNVNLIDLDGFDYLGLQLLSDGNLLMLNLGGLRIRIGLGEKDVDGNQNLIIQIGSSTVNVKMNPSGSIVADDEAKSAISLSLFEANRTAVKNGKVTGVIDGYDVLGGGYVENDSDGDGYDDKDDENHDKTDAGLWGYAGGFVGFHESSYFSNNEMLYCDVIAGSMSSRYFQKTGTVTTPGKVGPFTGGYNVNANTGNDSSARGITYFEGTNNRYHIYRNVPKNTTAELMLSNSPAVRSNVKLNGALDSKLTTYVRYNVQHRVNGASTLVDTPPTAAYTGVYHFSETQKNDANTGNDMTTFLEGAVYNTSTGGLSDVTLDAWISDGKAKLMLGTILDENTPHVVVPPLDINDPCDDIELTIVKVWENGENNLGNLANDQEQKFKVYQIISPTADRDILIDARTLGDLSRYRLMGTYTLGRLNDLTAEGLNRERERWEHTFYELPNDRDDPNGEVFYQFGTDANLPYPYGMSSGPKVFQSTSANLAQAKLKTDEHGVPVPVEGTVGQIPLYFQIANPDKFVVGEQVQLYYKDGNDYYPAFSYRVDKDNKLSYSANSYIGAPDDTATVNGKTCNVYYPNGDADGDALYVYEDQATQKRTLVRYRFRYDDPDTTTVNPDAEIWFDFGVDNSQNPTLTITQQVPTGAVTPVAGKPGYYTTSDNKLFRFEYSPSVGIVQMDYDLESSNNDNVVRETTKGNETFGYDGEDKLVRYVYVDTSVPGTTKPTAFAIRLLGEGEANATETRHDDILGDGYTVTYSDDGTSYTVEYDRAKNHGYTVSYSADGVVVEGTATDDAGGKRYVVTYDDEGNFLRLYYGADAPAVTTFASDRSNADGSFITFEASHANSAQAEYYGMDAHGELIRFKFTCPETSGPYQGKGFEIELDPDTGKVVNADNYNSIVVDGIRYTVDYNPDTREAKVYYVQKETVTVLDRENGTSVDREVYYYDTRVVNNDDVDEVWMDAEGQVIRVRRTVDGQTLTVLFNEDGTPYSAKEDSTSLFILKMSDVEREKIQQTGTKNDVVTGAAIDGGGTKTLTGYVRKTDGRAVYVSDEAGGTHKYYKRKNNVYYELNVTDDAAIISELDAYFAGSGDADAFSIRQVTDANNVQTYNCIVYQHKTDGSLLYVDNATSPTKYFDSAKRPMTAAPDMTKYEQVQTVRYALKVTNANGQTKALLRNDGGTIFLDYRTTGLLATGNIAYAEQYTDDKNGVHTFYFDAEGNLQRYVLVDADNQTLTIDNIQSSLATVETMTNGDTKIVTKELLRYDEDKNNVQYQYGSPSKRYYMEYNAVQEVYNSTVTTLSSDFVISYGLPDQPPTVFMNTNGETGTTAYFRPDGSLKQYIYPIPNSRTYERWAGYYTADLDIQVNQNGNITSVTAIKHPETLQGDALAVEITDGNNTPTVAVTYKYSYTTANNNYRERYFAISYDKDENKILVSESDSYFKSAHPSDTRTLFWYVDPVSDNYTYVYGFEKNPDTGEDELSYFRVDYFKDNGDLIGRAEILNIDKTTSREYGPITVSNTSQQITVSYNPKTKEMILERDNHNYTTVTNNGNFAYYKITQDNLEVHLDENHNVIYCVYDGTGSSDIGYYIDATGTHYVKGGIYSSYNLIPYDSQMSNNTWAYKVDTHKAYIKRKLSSIGDEHENTAELPFSSEYFDLNNVLEPEVFPEFKHDLEVTLPKPDISHEIPVEYEPNYTYDLPKPKATSEQGLVPPDADITYNLAQLLGLPEYAKRTTPVYYSYAIAEATDELPANYSLVDVSVDNDNATVTFTNRYEAPPYQLTLEKFDPDTQEKLEAEFLLYRYQKGGDLLTNTQEADGIQPDGDRERTMLLTGDETVFTVESAGTGYRFRFGKKYLGVNTIGLLSMLTDNGNSDRQARFTWTVTDLHNGVWKLENVGSAGVFLNVTGDGFTVDATPSEIKFWIVNDTETEATRGLAMENIVGKKVVIYNTQSDWALRISTGGLDGLSVVERTRPPFRYGVYMPTVMALPDGENAATMMTLVGSGNSRAIKNSEGKYLAINGDGKLVYQDTAYQWTFTFKEPDGTWRIVSASDASKALSFDAEKNLFVVGDAAATDQSTLRFLLFSPSTRVTDPLTPMTDVPDSAAIYFCADKVRMYYRNGQFDATKANAEQLKTTNGDPIVIDGLEEGEYYLEEVKAPDGYTLRKEHIQVLVSDKKPGKAADSNPGDDVPISMDISSHKVSVGVPNYMDRLKIVVDKFQSGDRSQKLAGAKFVLYRYPTEEERNLSDQEKQDTFGSTVLTETTPLYYVRANENVDVTYTTDLAQATERVTNENGYAEFTGIDEGEYYLMETEAPVDYRRMQGVVKLNVVAGGGGGNTGTDFVLVTEPDDNTVVAHVPNIPESTMPATGGQGVRLMLGVSLTLLTLGGAYLLYNALRKRREQDPDHPAA